MVGRYALQLRARTVGSDAREELPDLPLPAAEVRPEDLLLIGIGDLRGLKVLATPAEQEFSFAHSAEVPDPLRVAARGNEVAASAEASTLTGVRRGTPVLRPGTSRMREPQTLIPALVKAATMRLKTLRVNQSGAR